MTMSSLFSCNYESNELDKRLTNQNDLKIASQTGRCDDKYKSKKLE